MSKSRSRMGRTCRLLATPLAAILLISQPAAADTLLKEKGSVGTYAVTDTTDSPGGRCGYGLPNQNGVARFAWLKVKPPTVLARDITTERDRQPVEWRVRLQVAPSEAGPWKKVAASRWQRARAHDDTAAAFTRQKIGHSSKGVRWYRGVITIRWLRHGAVEGSAVVALDHYAVKWTVGDPAYVFDGPCWSKAD
jgi:hypothetical protein